MISLETAGRLRAGGVRWTPATGDRFVLPDIDLDDVFVLSTMIAESYRMPDGDVIGFNGTTEWALDSVEQREALWLPRETQLRDLLGGTFRSLSAVEGRWRVEVEINGVRTTFVDDDTEEAYGLALLHLVTGEPVSG